MRILGKPSPGLTLRVEIIDSNPPDSSSSMDELRFRGRSYPIGTQSGNMYVMCIDTSARPEDVVTQWEVSTSSFGLSTRSSALFVSNIAKQSCKTGALAMIESA